MRTQIVLIRLWSKFQAAIFEAMYETCPPDRKFTAALSDTLASEWLSKADEMAYGDL